ncbi:MAG: 7-cyano-7-deazaguanine synthase QueC [Endomicrobium sp.]|jgi:7-cyano-7-deazaguanine synthase|nr:7-cyano-7-deazaguanine synthase QueC [Endomicrobium sp.]
MKNNKKAVVLFSGGLDSTTVLYYALSKGYECSCLLFNYGQRHARELKSAVKIANNLKVPHFIVKLSLAWSNDALTNKNVKVPENKVAAKEIPVTYVPGRNTLFLSYGLSFAESAGASNIFIGANALDFSGYPDCRPQFIDSYNKLIKSLGLTIKVQAPLVHMTKARIIKMGIGLKVPYQYTWSCYKGFSKPCGVCDSCKLRAKGFKEAGMRDPALESLK